LEITQPDLASIGDKFVKDYGNFRKLVKTAPKVFNVWKGTKNFSKPFVFLRILKFVSSNDREVVMEFSFIFLGWKFAKFRHKKPRSH
jgi:hypothetical protein